MLKSVFAKYILTFMLIIFISFLILVVVVTSMVNNYAVSVKEEMLANTAAGVAEFLEARTTSMLKTDFARMVEGSREDVDSMLRSLAATDDGISILLVDHRGEIVRMISETGETGPSDAVIPRNVMNEVNNGVRLSEFEALEGVFDTPHFFYTAPVFVEDEVSVCGTVFACAATATQDDLLGVMIRTIIIASLWIMLLALIVVYLITLRVIGPLKDMSRMAKEFAAGRYDAHVEVRGNDEVAELAEAFNNMADSLSRLEVMRNTFVANVSHDLRTPMTTISGFIDNILSGAIPAEKRDYYLKLIRTEVQRLARLVSSLLDISRIQAGERRFDRHPFDICEMARRILISFEAKIEEKRLEIGFVCDEERIYAVADHDAIYQILYNLCDNAVKFSREGGALTVSLHEDGEKLTVSVYNEGEGIAESDLPFVFERFYKGDKSRGLDKSGAGLGLFIAKTIMDAHNERIWVESEQGVYCRFSFTLPMAQ
jgi:signal transduction histidine kinase